MSDNFITVVVTEQTIIPTVDENLVTVQVTENVIEVTNLYSGVSPVVSPGNTDFKKVTSEDISAFKVIAVINNLAEVADSSNLNHIWAVRGIAVNSVLSGGEVTIKTEGELSNGSWNWNMGQGIWFNSAGSLTQIQPVVGFGQVVAEPISPTRIYVKLRHPVRNN